MGIRGHGDAVAASLLDIIEAAIQAAIDEKENQERSGREDEDEEDTPTPTQVKVDKAKRALLDYYCQDSSASWMVAARHNGFDDAIRLCASRHYPMTETQARTLVEIYNDSRGK